MASTALNDTSFDPSLYLLPNEQDLLMTALKSNKPATTNTNRSYQSASMDSTRPGLVSSPHKQQPSFGDFSYNDIYKSPIQQHPGSGSFDSLGFDDSPFLDYELDDPNFVWDTSGDQMIGSLPGTSIQDDDEDNELHDKRKNPDDDQDEEEGSGKRRESDDKTSKKPGRKPLTSEPTSKRKAQNRAAQRAFRERKERHLKELETKVDDLEKASESANHENGLLRAQVDRLQSELKEYRKKLSVNGNGVNRSPPPQPMFSRSNWDINNNFQFEFPKFGGISSGKVNSSMSNAGPKDNTAFNESPRTLISQSRSASQANLNTLRTNGMKELSDIFSPSILESASRSNSDDYMSTTATSQQSHASSMNGTDTTSSRANTNCGTSVCTTASPSTSISQGELNSSCGTSPESSIDSPGLRKPSEGAIVTASNDGARRKSEGEKAFCNLLSTACGTKDNPIPLKMSQSNETSSATTETTPGSDFLGIDWMAQQNGGTFDPVLFGDYRDPQESIMGGDFGAFFNDAFPIPDLQSPSNIILEPKLPPKKTLMDEIEERQSGNEPEVVPGEPVKQFITCNLLWDRVQKSEKVLMGEADMDDLCTQLKSKAKCSGTGAVIDQKDVDAILGPAPMDQLGFLKMFRIDVNHGKGMDNGWNVWLNV